MKSATIALSLFAALAVAITNDELAAKISPCSKDCLEDAYKVVGCGLTDYPCQCDHAGDIFNMSMPCMTAGCTDKEIERTAAANTYLCMGISQQQNPNWTGPPITDHLPPILLSRSVERSAAVVQAVASIGVVAAAAVFALAL